MNARSHLSGPNTFTCGFVAAIGILFSVVDQRGVSACISGSVHKVSGPNTRKILPAVQDWVDL